MGNSNLIPAVTMTTAGKEWRKLSIHCGLQTINSVGHYIEKQLNLYKSPNRIIIEKYNVLCMRLVRVLQRQTPHNELYVKNFE